MVPFLRPLRGTDDMASRNFAGAEARLNGAEACNGIIDVSATNIRGMGATQLVASLLPALETSPGITLRTILLPQGGPLSDYRRRTAGEVPRRYKRILPNAISRALECTVFSRKVGGSVPLLVLGDLPIWHTAGQIVLVHSPHLLLHPSRGSGADPFKYRISRALFRLNLRFISWVIVQTEMMRAAMQAAYPALEGKLVVIPQPPPEWLLNCDLRRASRAAAAGPLRLFYPAADYPHKNHQILQAFVRQGLGEGLVANITLTLDPPDGHESGAVLRYRGALGPAEMIDCYAHADALVFPSLKESYGLPLVEAMHLGLPIICAERDYGHALCGSEAIYFDPSSAESLRTALAELQTRLNSGWWPDWTERLSRIPESWDDVAARMLSLFGTQRDVTP